VAVGGSATISFLIANQGGRVVRVEATEECPDFEIISGTPSELPRNRDVWIVVRFSPSSPGPRSCALSIGPDCEPVVCSAVGVEAASSVSPLELDFGKVALGESSTRTVQVRNSGQSGFAASPRSSCEAMFVSGDDRYHITPGESFQLPVTFRPEQPGVFTCTIDTGAGTIVSVRGEGAGSAPVRPSTWSEIKVRFR
jgi:hypothetical protein